MLKKSNILRKSFFLNFVISILIHTTLNAQNEKKHDSIPSPNYKPVFATNLNNYIGNDVTWYEPDTLLSQFSDYDVVNNQTFCYSTLGNIGSSHKLLDYKNNVFGFRFKDIPLNEYLVTKNNISIFRPTSPYTKLHYVTGSGKQHVLGGNHAQQIKHILFGLNFNLINSLGTYQHQKNNVSGASVYTSYLNKNKKYGALVVYFFNNVNLQENGGLANDSLFENNIEIYRAGMPVRFEKSQNKYIDNNLFLNQYFKFRKNIDSVTSIFNLGSIVHSIDFSKGKWIYSDENVDSLTSNVFYRDSLNTLDSLGFVKISNTIEWKNSFNFSKLHKQRKLYTNWGITHEFINVGDYKVSKTFQNLTLNSSIFIKWDSIFAINYQVKYILSGYGNGDYMQTLNFMYHLNKNNVVNIDFIDQKNPPSYFSNNYHSNYYDWKNEFESTHETKLGISISNKFVNLGIDGIRVKNYLYLNHSSQFEIYNHNINIFRAWSLINLKWKYLNSQSRITYNYNNSTSILCFPDFTFRERLYFVFPLFNNAMLANVGVDATYMPKFYASFYNQSMFDFYVNQQKQIGNFVFLDVFVGFKVKRFNFFVKLINAPKGFLPYNYYASPNYPLPDRQFKIGFSWRFYD